jgi:hypothetical protein
VPLPSLLEQIEHVPVSSLTLYPGNARKGDIPAIAASLRENGQVTPLVVQASTRHVLGGNNTLQAAQSLGWDEIGVTFIDVDDHRAAKINAVLNRTADLATYDNTLLLAQLTDLDDLTGTGYGLDDMDELRRLTGAFGREATAFLDDFTTPPPAPAPSPLPGDWPEPPPPGGDEDGSRLSYSTGTPPPPAPGQPPPGPEWVQLAWVVTPGHRETIRQAVTHAQQAGGLATGAEGLLAVAAHYLDTIRQEGHANP